MRIAARLMGVLLLTVGLAACDTDEVLQLASQNGTVTITALGLDTHYFDIWEAFEDNDDDDVEDPGTVPFLWCIAERDPTTGVFFRTSVRSAPWQHSFRVSIRRAGTSTFEPITDDLYLDPTTNVTPFDTKVFGVMIAPDPLPITLTDFTDPMNPVDRTFKFRPYLGQRLTALNAAVVAANRDANSITQLDGSYNYGNGLCSDAPASVVALTTQAAPLLGATPPYTFALAKGETVRIEATKYSDPLPGLVISQPALSADLFIDGVRANDLVVGARGTGTLPEESLSFTYTSR